MAESAEKVLHELTQGGLLTSDHATKYGEEIDTGADALLMRLVADGHITQYQANKFKHGKSSDIYFGDYVVLDKLGQGGMGTVLLSRHRVMDRKVAIKVLPVTVLESKDAVARFYQEVKVAAQLKHENIVHAYDAREHHGYHYLVMEYVKGHDLAQVLSQLGPIPAPLALDYITQAASGLDYAHRIDIIHRDIKPSNLLLDDEGKIKILDMGLARIGNALDQETSMHLTTTGQVMGTVEYMSPEQAEDTRQADARSDIYSLGCTLYRLLTGKGPFTRETVVKTILAHRDAEIPVVETGMPEDAAINGLLRKMIAKKPEDRFQSTGQVLEALRKIEQGKYEDIDRPEPRFVTASEIPIVNPATPNTAVAVRFENSVSDTSIPEAIIPHEPSRKMVSDESVVSITSGYGKQSEVLYIPDIVPPKGPIRRARQWVKDNRSHGILVWSLISFCIGLIPFAGTLGFVFAWFTWRAAKQHIKDITEGKKTPHGFWMARLGKWISMAVTIISLVWFVKWIIFATN